MNKKSLLFLSLFLINFGAFSETNRDFDQFLKILSKLESSDNPRAHNKKENAIGIYQIRLLYFKDAQKFDKSLEKYTHSDCFDPEIARKVVKSYLSRYCKNGSFEDMARCHNSGPNWKNKKEKTEKYIRKFRLHKK